MRFLLASLLLCVIIPIKAADSSTQPTTAPYIEAIAIVRDLSEGPDNALIDGDAPLDDRTANFLSKNEKVFTLLHEAAANDEPQWSTPTGDMNELLHQLSPARGLVNLGVLRARLLMKQAKPNEAVDELLDVMAFGRNIDRANPVLVTSLVAIGADERAMNELAAIIPSLPKETLATLPDRLAQLPGATPFADLIRGEQKFGGGMLTQQLKAPDAAKAFDAMSPFYDAMKKAADQSPPLSAGDFKQKVTDAVSTINADQPISRALAQNMVTSFAAFYTTYCTRVAHRAMLTAGILVVRDGDDAIKSCADPFSDGPFALTRSQDGFTLSSKLVDRDKKPVTIQFGK